MKHSLPFDAMEIAARQHAQLDKKTAVLWEEEAEVCAKLKMIDRRLMVLRVSSGSAKQKDRQKAVSVADRMRNDQAALNA